MALVEAWNVTHAYRRFPGRRHPSLSGVDLAVEPGECWGLIGPNGSGKSTLLRILAGLTTPLTGDVAVAGHPVGTRAARRVVAYVPETLRWPRHLTVWAALRELAALGDVRDVEARVQRVLRLLGLQPLVRRQLGSLSLGQARRVVIAQALMDDARVLLMDEPFSALDSLVLHDVTSELTERLARGAAVLLASHRIEDLRRLATHILVLREGRVVRVGTADELLAGVTGRDALVHLVGSADAAPSGRSA